jgi:hypothetical protein
MLEMETAMESLTMPTRKFAFFLLAAAVMLAPYARQSIAEEAMPAASTTAAAFSQQELDEILAPIALYPDALLAQVFMASTYPIEIVEAARWAKANPNLEGTALEDALQEQSWDPAVKAIVAVPPVLTMMDEKLDWTHKLGDAFLAQQEDVMKTVQSLRRKAKDAGNLESTPEQTVKTEEQGGQTVVIIESPQPEKIYVPVYNPTVIYGSWWYPYPPPYYYYPPGYVVGVGLWFTAGIIVGRAIWGGCHWGRYNINININRYNSFNRTNINTRDWKHNPAHRKGAAYRDPATARKFDRGSDRAAAKSREQFRGRAEQGRAELKTMDRAQLDSKVRAADRAARSDLGARGGASPSPGASRDVGSRAGATPGTGAGRDLGSRKDTRPAGDARRDPGSRGGGFSGAGSGASQRSASSRGGASFGSRSGGMGGARASGGLRR